jgi:hypothetical protein
MENRQADHLEVTTYIGCPNRCSYCPQGTLLEAYKGVKVMSLDDFRIILSHTPKSVDIHFSGFSELFFHPHALEFIDEAFKEHEVVIYTTTNGMTQDVADKLAGYNFKDFNVHLNPNKGKVQLNFKYNTTLVDDSNKVSRGGNLWETKEHKGVCINSPEYRQNVVLPNGDVYLCCMDYGLKHKMGNLLEQSFDDLRREDNYDICKHCEKYA